MNMYEGKNSDPKTVVSGRGSNEYGAIFCTLLIQVLNKELSLCTGGQCMSIIILSRTAGMQIKNNYIKV